MASSSLGTGDASCLLLLLGANLTICREISLRLLLGDGKVAALEVLDALSDQVIDAHIFLHDARPTRGRTMRRAVSPRRSG